MDECKPLVDGTLSGAAPGTTVVPDWAHLRGDCALESSVLAGGSASLMCPPTSRAFRIAAMSQQPSSVFRYRSLLATHWNPATNVTSGTSTVPYRNNMWHDPKDGWALPLTVGGFYDIGWVDRADFTTMVFQVTGLLPGDHAYVRFKTSADWAYWKVIVNGVVKVPSLAIIPSPGSATGAAYHDVIGRSLTVMLSGQSNLNGAPGVMQSLRLTPDECPREVGRCRLTISKPLLKLVSKPLLKPESASDFCA